MNTNNSRIMIGTAQWGLDYGISNNKGKTSRQEIIEILNYAQENGVNSIDTASAYGNSETMIGELAYQNTIITTKISIGCQNRDIELLKTETEMKVENSIKELGNRSLLCVLIHDPENLENIKASVSWETLIKLRDNQNIQKIGISVSGPRQAERLTKQFKPDIIQIPINVFDQRAISYGTLNKLKEQEIEIHARSIFLQGLLLMKTESINEYFRPWLRRIEDWHKYCEEKEWSLMEGALTYLFMEENIDKYIIGIAEKSQLEEIVETIKVLSKQNYLSDFSSTDEGLINPTRWRLKI